VRQGGRLEKLTGFYLPGRDFSPWLERLGKALLLLSLLGVIVHGSARIWISRSRKEA
jgi:hypothetical protein